MSSMNSGQRLSGRYTVRQRLGAGAQGETWRARDATREREVVIRVLSDSVTQDSAILESLSIELAAARSIDSPAVAAAGSLEHDGEQFYLVRDFVPGVDLTTLRARLVARHRAGRRAGRRCAFDFAPSRIRSSRRQTRQRHPAAGRNGDPHRLRKRITRRRQFDQRCVVAL